MNVQQETVDAMADFVDSSLKVSYGRRSHVARQGQSSKDATLAHAAASAQRRPAHQLRDVAESGPPQQPATLFVAANGEKLERVRRAADLVPGYSIAIQSLVDLALSGSARETAGCVVCFGGTDNPTELAQLRQIVLEDPPPIVLIVGEGQARSMLDAVHLNVFAAAADPCPDDLLSGMLRGAIQNDYASRAAAIFREECCQAYRSLTDRERLLVARILSGSLNKNIASEMDVSVRTIESWRAAVYRRFGVASTGELAQRYMIAEFRLLLRTNS